MGQAGRGGSVDVGAPAGGVVRAGASAATGEPATPKMGELPGEARRTADAEASGCDPGETDAGVDASGGLLRRVRRRCFFG